MRSCELSPCLNGGTCLDLPSPPHYLCVCPPSSAHPLPLGAHCEPLSPCDAMPCPPHSTCVVVDEPAAAYRCVCDDDRCRQVARAVTSVGPRDHHTGVYHGSNKNTVAAAVITFRVSLSDDAKCILVTRVCVSVCLSVSLSVPAFSHSSTDQDVT